MHTVWRRKMTEGKKAMARTLGRITVDELEKLASKNNCTCDDLDEDLNDFKWEWPEGMAITLGNLKKAVRQGLNIGWYVKRVLSSEAWELYEKVSGPADVAYVDAWEVVRVAYYKATEEAAYIRAVACAAAEDAFLKVEKPAREVRTKAVAPAARLREQIKAQAFLDAYRLTKGVRRK